MREEDKMIPSRVLIADDDPSIRRLLSMSLRLCGFQVIEARNGREALIEMGGGNADVVLLDLMMPEVSGWDVLRARSADPSLQRIPVIVMTATNERKVTPELLNTQIDAMLAKPFDLDAVAASVTASLERAKAAAPAAA
jgi:two-component system, OmpR family, response regulator MprA